ncbi:MAG: IclR family transcriptional regulator [Proteobacteria bacterium]|nr:IclR family transcriptional regulator [Pseudomonadota bacterium]
MNRSMFHSSASASFHFDNPSLQRSGGHGSIVTPFARALSVLSAFTLKDRWLGNGDLAQRTGLPASTVTRMTRTLIALGYLRCSADTRRFCLSPSALTLGYRAAADTEIHYAVNHHMAQFAERHHVQVHLSLRDKFNLVIIDSCRTSALPALLQPGIGTRLLLASSAAGWALLASLPETERNYLLQSMKYPPQDAGKQIRLRLNEAIGQIREDGFCVALGQSGQPMTMVAAPIKLSGQAPLAVSCMGPAMLMGRARSVRELGPALVRMTQKIQHGQEPP